MSPLQPKTTMRQKKTALMEQMRAKILHADSHIEHLEAYQAFCGLCKKWVTLDKRRTYQVAHWLQHTKSDEHVRRAKAVSQPQGQSHHNEKEENSSSGVLCRREVKLTLAQQQRAERLRTDPDIGDVHEYRVFCRICHVWVELSKVYQYCMYTWVRHRNGRAHVSLAAEQGRHPQARLDVLPNASQNHDSKDDNSSTASSPSSRYTPLSDLPMPEPLAGPIDPCAMASYTLSVPDAPDSAHFFDECPSSTAGAPHPAVHHPIVIPRYEPRARAPAMSSILYFIRSELPSSIPFTIEELETTARVIHELAEQGAIEIDGCLSD